MSDRLSQLLLPYGTFHACPLDTFNAEVQATGFWDHDLRPFLDRIPAGATVIDVGAHIGLYTGYLASRGVHVHAVEAHPFYLPLLQANVAANAWGHLVTIHPVFLYSTLCRLWERREHETPASNTWLPAREGALCGFLDDIGLPLPRVAAVKVDAQGADLHVLLGGEALIERDHPMILIEYEEKLAALHGHSPTQYAAWRDGHGYRQEDINGWNACWVWDTVVGVPV